jgi:hypothetical protein
MNHDNTRAPRVDPVATRRTALTMQHRHEHSERAWHARFGVDRVGREWEGVNPGYDGTARTSHLNMDSPRYTVVLTRGSFCTNGEGRKAVLSSLRMKARNAVIPVLDMFSGLEKVETVDLLELVTILKHDSGANQAVLKQLLMSEDVVVPMSRYIARRSGLSSAR